MKILLATDGSPHAEAAAKFLCRLRCDDPIEITLLTNVYLPGAESGVMTNPMLQEYKEHQQHVADDNLKHVTSILREFKGTVTEMVAEGHVGHSIIEAAEKVEADLIVVGAKGHSAIHRMLLGSVSDYVASHAECSVLVIRPTQDEGESANLNVTLAIDDSPPSDVAVEQLKRFNWGSNNEGQLLSVVPVFRFYRQDLVPSNIEQRTERRQAARQHAEKVILQLNDHTPRFKANVIEADHIGEGIIGFLQSHSTDLVVIGAGQNTSLGRLVLGSVSRYILRHASCSVWIARDRAKLP